MDVQDLTGLSVFPIDQVDRHRNRLKVILAKGSFHIDERGELHLLGNQCAPTLTDEYPEGDVGAGLRRASELCYFKPRTDIYFIDPIARPPAGKRAAQWPVTITFGTIRVDFHVTGDRYWERTLLGGWRLSPPEPCDAVPINYQAAFGGEGDIGKNASAFNENPIGRGLYSEEALRLGQPLQAPSVFSEQAPPTVPNERCRVVGLTPVAPSWAPRIQHAGTFDADWLEHDWPHYPADFSESFFNSAPPVLQYPGYVRGGERVEVQGMSDEPSTAFSIPDLGHPTLTTYSMEGVTATHRLHMDTVAIDLDARRVEIAWRTTVPADAPIFFSQLRFVD